MSFPCPWRRQWSVVMVVGLRWHDSLCHGPSINTRMARLEKLVLGEVIPEGCPAALHSRGGRLLPLCFAEKTRTDGIACSQ